MCQQFFASPCSLVSTFSLLHAHQADCWQWIPFILKIYIKRKKFTKNLKYFPYFFIAVVSTSTPSNEAELQLYRVLQKASLLAYYDTLLEMGKWNWNQPANSSTSNPIQIEISQTITFTANLGGDDVQQLCDAGEDEFLEIMALVGMATKPLHVRRFQKALAEWVNNPAAFQTPLSTSIGESEIVLAAPHKCNEIIAFSRPQIHLVLNSVRSQ